MFDIDYHTLPWYNFYNDSAIFKKVIAIDNKGCEFLKKNLFLMLILCLCLLCACNTADGQPSDVDTNTELSSENDTDTAVSSESDTSPDTSQPNNEGADTIKYVAKNGFAYQRWKINIVATEFVNPDDYVGEGPFDFFGVPIIAFQKTKSSYPDRELYTITISHELDTFETAEYLHNLDGIIQAVPQFAGLGSNWRHYTTNFEVDESPYKHYTEEERKRFELFIPDEFTVQFNHELDLSEFEGEGTHYLIGVAVSEISRIEDAEGFVYRLKLGKPNMFNIAALAVFETNDDVLSVEFESLYGKGDLNEDKKVDNEDIRFLEQIVKKEKKMTYWTAGYGDMNNDATLDETDLQLLKEKVNG